MKFRQFSLVGHGARQVTIFRFNTYAIAVYLQNNDIRQLVQKQPQQQQEKQQTPEEQLQQLLDKILISNAHSKLIRIVPVRLV